MGWSTTSDLDLFAATAGGYLTSRAAENALLLSAAQAARNGLRQDPRQGTGLLFGWWTPPDRGDARGAFVHDPVAPLLLSGRAPEMAAALAGTLARVGRQVCGVDAPTEAADAFAAVWSQQVGTAVRAHRTCRVYRLTAQGTPRQAAPSQATGPAAGTGPPTDLPGPPGRLRVAGPEDHAMLADWLRAAATETGQRLTSPSDLAADLISYGGAVFLEVPPKSSRLLSIPHHREVQPVALATLTRPVAGTVRIGMFYTPPERRRRGYAAAVIQGVSRAVLRGPAPDSPVSDSTVPDNGVPGLLGTASAPGCVREVVMVTDENRPDRWGGRFGYQLVGERAVLRFGPATGPMPRSNPTKPLPRLPTGPLPRLPRLRR